MRIQSIVSASKRGFAPSSKKVFTSTSSCRINKSFSSLSVFATSSMNTVSNGTIEGSGSDWTKSTINRNVIKGSRQYTTHSQLPEEHQMIYEMCRKFADEELAPNAGKWDQEHAFPSDAISQLVSLKR